MFVPVTILLMMHIRPSAQATQLSCNLDIHYRLYSSGKLVKCVDCRECGPGLQPDITCGTIIDKDTSIGPCQLCPKGTFSIKKDTKSCEKCQSESCFAHQVIQGTCTRKNDTSRCINECDTGYEMNADQTICVMNNPDNGTTKRPAKSNTTIKDNATEPPTSNVPTTLLQTPPTIPLKSPTNTHHSNHPTTPMKGPPTTPSTKSPSTTPSINPQTTPSRLSTVVIIVIIIAVFILIIVIIAFLFWYLRKTQDPRGCGAGLQCAKPHAGEEENVRFIKEEECKETGSPSSQMHCTETSGGFESSKPQETVALLNNGNSDGETHTPPKQDDPLIIANGTNVANSSGISPPPRNTQVVIDMPEQSPVAVFLGPVPTPQMLVCNSCQQSSQTVVFTENPSVLGFNDMPYSICKTIHDTFDVCGGAKSWRDVASWLELGLNDVKHIGMMDANRGTEKVIETWVNKTGNGVKEFVKILRKNEMTNLADVIDTWIQSLEEK